MIIEDACINCEFIRLNDSYGWREHKKRVAYATCGHVESRHNHRHNVVTGVESHTYYDCSDMRMSSGACGREGLLFMEKKSLFKRLLRA